MATERREGSIIGSRCEEGCLGGGPSMCESPRPQRGAPARSSRPREPSARLDAAVGRGDREQCRRKLIDPGGMGKPATGGSPERTGAGTATRLVWRQARTDGAVRGAISSAIVCPSSRQIGTWSASSAQPGPVPVPGPDTFNENDQSGNGQKTSMPSPVAVASSGKKNWESISFRSLFSVIYGTLACECCDAARP